MLAGKVLLKAKCRGRPPNRQNNKDIDTTSQTPQQIKEQRLITENELLSLVVIDKQIIPQVLENKRLIQETDVLVVFDKMCISKQKILDRGIFLGYKISRVYTILSDQRNEKPLSKMCGYIICRRYIQN